MLFPQRLTRQSNIRKSTGRVRGLSAGFNKDDDEQVAMTSTGEMLVVDGLPSKTDLVRQGNSWVCTNYNAFATQLALSSNAQYAIFNSAANPNHLVVDSVCCVQQDDFSSNERYTVLAQVNAFNPASFTANTAATITSMSGRPKYDGYVIPYGQGDPMASATKWQPIGTSQPCTFGDRFTTRWQAIEIPLYGQWFVPPGQGFIVRLQITTINGPQRVGASIRWHELSGTPASR